MPRRLFRDLAAAIALFLLYVATAKAGLRLAVVHPSATAVWAPTGIALAALLVLGRRFWPAIFAAAFLVNATTAGSLPAALAVAAGNTLEAVLGAWLVGRFAGGLDAFERVADVFRYLLFTALAAMVSASIGVTALCLDGSAPWGRFGPIWATWWAGDLAGALLVAPALLLWARRPRIDLNSRRLAEAAALAAAALLAGLLLFDPRSPLAATRYPLQFLFVPLLVWVALRFTQRETVTVCLFLAALAVWGTARGFGPFGALPKGEALVVLQAFMGVAVVTTLVLAALVEERQQTVKSLRLLETAVQHADEGVVVLGSRSGSEAARLLFANDTFLRITGLRRSAVIGRGLEVLGVSPDLSGGRPRGDAGPIRIEAEASRADGSRYALEVRLMPVASRREESRYWLGIARDVSERNARLAQLQRQALFDFLTGLPNRAMLRERLEQAIRQTGRSAAPLALMFLDLDRFKQINDAFGHHAGDVLLREIGQRLQGRLRAGDTIARLGGDEFAILLPGTSGEEDAAAAAERVREAFARPFEVEGSPFEVSASIGVSLCPEHALDASALMRFADLAMYRAKRSGAGYSVYRPPAGETSAAAPGPPRALR